MRRIIMEARAPDWARPAPPFSYSPCPLPTVSATAFAASR
jgi:hypothetical protein